MNLPSIEIKTFEVELKEGATVKFREPLASEFDLITELEGKELNMKMASELIGSLMCDYEESLEDRIAYIMKLPIGYIRILVSGIIDYVVGSSKKKEVMA